MEFSLKLTQETREDRYRKGGGEGRGESGRGKSRERGGKEGRGESGRGKRGERVKMEGGGRGQKEEEKRRRGMVVKLHVQSV